MTYTISVADRAFNTVWGVYSRVIFRRIDLCGQDKAQNTLQLEAIGHI